MIKNKLKIGQAKCKYCGYITTTGGIENHSLYCSDNPNKLIKENQPKPKVLSIKKFKKLLGIK